MGRRSAPSLNVLMVAPTGFFSDYGCHVRILEEAVFLQDRGHQPTICTYHRGQDLASLTIVRIPRVPWGGGYTMGSSWHKLSFDVLLLVRAYAAFRTRPPDLIHAFLHEGAWVGYCLSRLWGVPLVFDYQGSLTAEMVDHGFLNEQGPMYRLVRRLERQINNLPDAVITSSAHALQVLKEDFDCRCRIMRTVPDGVDTKRFSRAGSREDVKALFGQLNLPAEARIIAYLGKLAEYQGTGLLLEAAARLCRRHPDIHFLIMGYPHVREYAARAAALGISHRVTFTGRVPYAEAPRYLSLADIAVAPKLSETESNGKLLNYMAMGLPTVAFDMPVAREYLGDCGCYAPSRDIEGLAVAIESALVSAVELREWGQRLRERAVQCYSWRQVGERIEEVYSMLLNGSVTCTASASRPGEDWLGADRFRRLGGT